MSSPNELGVILARIEERLDQLERGSPLKHSSLENSGLPVYDDSGQLRTTVGRQDDGAFTVVDSNAPPPPTPAVATLDASQPGLLLVSSFALTTDGVEWPSDFAHIACHVSQAGDTFIPSAATKLGQFGRDGGVLTLALDPGDWWVKLVAVNTSRVQSVASTAATATVTAAVLVGGIKTYHTDEMPVGLTAADDGALWYDSNGGNTQYRWDGTILEWTPLLIGTGAIEPGSVSVTEIADDSISTPKLQANAVTAEVLAAEIALLSRLVIEEGSDAAIEIFGQNGGYTLLSALSSLFSGRVTAESMTCLGDFDVRGLTYLMNVWTLGTGVGDPAQELNVTTDHARFTLPNAGYNRRGLTTYHDGLGAWVTTDSVALYGSSIQILGLDGIIYPFADVVAGFLSFGGITRLGDTYYVLCAPYDGQGSWVKDDWRVLRYASDGTYLGGWSCNAGGVLVTGGAYPTIGSDGTNLLVGFVTGAGNLWVKEFTPAGARIGQTLLSSLWGASNHVTSITRSSVGMAGTRYIASSSAAIATFTTAGARTTADDWPAVTTDLRGMTLDATGSSWHSFHSGRYIYDYTLNTGTWRWAYDWTDSDSGGLGIAHTRPSPVLVYAPRKFARWTVTVPSDPPDDGTTDGANTARILAAPNDGSLLVEQVTLPEGQLSAIIVPSQTGAPASTTNQFADQERPGAIGSLVSAVLTAAGLPAIELTGNGTYRLDPAGNLNDTGWASALLAGSWSNYGSGYQQVEFCRVDGWTEIRGVAKGGTGIVFTLPPGYRPEAVEPFTVEGSSAYARVNVSTNGQVVLMVGSGTADLSLSGIRFRAVEV